MQDALVYCVVFMVLGSAMVFCKPADVLTASRPTQRLLGPHGVLTMLIPATISMVRAIRAMNFLELQLIL